MLGPRRETGSRLARKMWRWFVSDPPDEDGVAQLAQVYLDSRYDIRAMLRWLFLSAAFRAEAAVYQTLKNPAEYIAGLYKTLGLADPALLGAGAEARLMRMH